MVQDAPLLEQGLELYWRAFWDLITCRGWHGTIPWTAVDQWALRYRLSNEQRELLTFYVRAMEEEWAAWEEKQKPAK